MDFNFVKHNENMSFDWNSWPKAEPDKNILFFYYLFILRKFEDILYYFQQDIDTLTVLKGQDQILKYLDRQ